MRLELLIERSFIGHNRVCWVVQRTMNLVQSVLRIARFLQTNEKRWHYIHVDAHTAQLEKSVVCENRSFVL